MDIDIRRELIVDLFSLNMKEYDNVENGCKVFFTDYDSLTQTFCFRRVIRDLGYKITSTERIVDEDDEVLERHFITNISIQQGNEMGRIYDEYLWGDEVVFYNTSGSDNTPPEEDEPQNDDSDSQN